MKVDNCPKRLNRCNQMCPEYPCWAYDQHMDNKDREEKERNAGWE